MDATLAAQPDKNKEIMEFIEKSRSLLHEKSLEETADDGTTCIINDVQEEMSMLEWAGVSFGKAENYRLFKSMKRHASLSGATMLRFWGKFYCS